jgi:isoleucyl-tRNA synthetase
VEEYGENLNNYDIRRPTILLEDFFDDLTNWYVRSSRRRFWKEVNSEDKNAAYSTLYQVLLNVSYLLAPYMPFLAEHVFQLLKKPLADELPESIHLDFISIKQETDLSLLADFKTYQKLVELGRSLRNRAGIKLRHPLSLAIISCELNFSSNIFSTQFLEALRAELNVKKLTCVNKFSREETNNHRYLRAESKEDDLTIILDTKISEKLKQEGLAKDIVRAIQQLRKEADLVWDQKIIVKYETHTEEILESLKQFKDYVKNETLCLDISSDRLNNGKEFFIYDSSIKLAIEVVSR